MQYDNGSSSRLKLNKNHILLALIAVALFMAIIAGIEDGRFDWRGFTGNLSTELIGAVITYWIIDRIINTQEHETQLKQRLIREMSNGNNGVSSRAVAELRSNGWLQDGSLKGWFLTDADLRGVYLKDADVGGLGIYRTDLTGAKITDEQLLSLNDLRRSTLPDGSLYDGRFCLSGDLEWARTKYHIDPATAPAQEMAGFYEVTVEQYIEGQRWALENIPDRVPNPSLVVE